MSRRTTLLVLALAALPRLIVFPFAENVAGDAAFEASFEQSRGSILIGGRITDAAGSANPLKFTLSAGFAAPYPYVKEDQDEITGKEFQKKIKAM